MDRKTFRIARKLVAMARSLMAMSYKYVADASKDEFGNVIKWGYENEWHNQMKGFTGLIDFGKTSCRVRDAYFTLEGDMVNWEKGWLEQGTFYGNWEDGTNEGGTFIGGTIHKCEWIDGDFLDGIATAVNPTDIEFKGGSLKGGEIIGAIILGAKIEGAKCNECEFKEGKFLSGYWEGGKWLSSTEPEPPHDVEIVRATGDDERPYQLSNGDTPMIDGNGGYGGSGHSIDEEESDESVYETPFNDPTPLPANTTRLGDTVDFHREMENAIRDHRMVRFNYMKRDGEVEVIDFLPIELKMRRNDDEICIGWKNGEEGNEEMRRTLHVQSMGDRNKVMESVPSRSLTVNDTDNVDDIQQQLENAKNGSEYVSWYAETGKGNMFRVTGIPIELRRYQQKKQVGYSEDILMCKFKATNGQEVTYGVKIHKGSVWKKPKGFEKFYVVSVDNPESGRKTVEFDAAMTDEETSADGRGWRENGYYVQCYNKAKSELDAVMNSIQGRLRLDERHISPEVMQEESRGRILYGWSYIDCLTQEQVDKVVKILGKNGFHSATQDENEAFDSGN